MCAVELHHKSTHNHSQFNYLGVMKNMPLLGLPWLAKKSSWDG